ncbi:hypothetical protein BH09CHL1_BH09CHL1_16910 [soil metagenome]
MKHREIAQDSLSIALATKASFLFTAGLASVGALAAFSGFMSNENKDTDYWRAFWPVFVSSIALVGLTFSFVQAYRVQSFQRSPDVSELWKLRERNVIDVSTDIADGRRYSVATNAVKLSEQAKWINWELASLVTLIFGLIATAVTLLLG